jgi:hypothetical protein
MCVCFFDELPEPQIYIFASTNMKTKTQAKPYRLGIKRHDGITYFTVNEQERLQFSGLSLGIIEPDRCRWTIQPAKLDWSAYEPRAMSCGELTYVITNEEEMEYALGSGWGGKDDPNFRFTIPPYRYTAS